LSCIKLEPYTPVFTELQGPARQKHVGFEVRITGNESAGNERTHVLTSGGPEPGADSDCTRLRTWGFDNE